MSKPDQLIRELRDTLDEARSYVGGPQFSPSMDSECADAVHKATAWLDSRPTEAAAMAATVPAGAKYDETLLPFVEMMRKELHANADKGDRPGWLSMSAQTCLLEIYWHVSKLSVAVRDKSLARIQEHAADVANMAMMQADIAGAFCAPPDSYAAPQAPVAGQPAEPSPAEPEVDLRCLLLDIIVEHLALTYHCTRVWEAWNVGTMSQEDFEEVNESNTPDELVDAIIAALNARAAPKGDSNG